MSSDAVPRSRVRATTSKERLFAASMTLLGQRGINSVSVEEIARAAGVSKGTVYYNFGSKDSMIGAMLEFGAQSLLDELEQDAAEPEGLKALQDMVLSAFRFVQAYPSYAQLWISEQQRGESPWSADVDKFRRLITEQIAAVLRRTVAVPEPLLIASAKAMFGAALLTARERALSDPMPDLGTCVQAVMATVYGLQQLASGTYRFQDS